MELNKYIRDVKDFPKEGIIFKDITPLLKDSEAFNYCINQMANDLSKVDFDYILSPESRGFIFGTPLSNIMKKGFVPVRKKGKLPYKTVAQSYKLEYGEATIEIHADAIKSGDRVVIVDDVLATGGTVKAICQLVESLGAEVVLIETLAELDFLNPRKLLSNYKISSLLSF